MVRDLIKFGSTVDKPNNRNETPLHWAVRMNSLLVVLCLVKSGANVHYKAGDGMSPLELAESDPHNPKLLEALKMDPITNSMDPLGNPEIEVQSPFYIAIPQELLRHSFEEADGSISQTYLERQRGPDSPLVTFDPKSTSLPPIVEEIVIFIQSTSAIDEEGIFRVSGPARELQEIFAYYAKGICLHLKKKKKCFKISRFVKVEKIAI